MTSTRRTIYVGALAISVALLVLTGCDRDDSLLEPVPFPSNPDVFLDGFSAGLDYSAFGSSKLDALDIDSNVKYRGTQSLRVTVPGEGDPSGFFAGGAFFSSVGRDLTGYDALTFWAKSSQAATLNLVGLGNDNMSSTRFVATLSDLPLTTAWRKFVIPLPEASKLTEERGLFFFSDGADEGKGYEVWFDEVQYERLGTLARYRPTIAEQTVDVKVGDSLNVIGTSVTVDVDGVDVLVGAAPAYFTFRSSDESVATVNSDGLIRAVGLGSADITALLGSDNASGTVVVNVVEAPPGPATPAPVPTAPADQVTSLFSNAYEDVAVDTWSAGFDVADLEDIQINGDDVKLYTNLQFAAAEFISSRVDASNRDRFHMDIWTPDDTALPAVFRVKLVDFGGDGAFGGGDDSEHELTFDASTTPALQTATWVGIDVPMSAFAGLTSRSNLAQLIISGDPNTVYVDNVYFYGEGGGGQTEPTAPAPVPMEPAGEVISLFSGAYDDVTVDLWSTDWDDTELADVQVAGDD
ncbi:MAG: Ig-like domain-containing protein, partial [Rhodothermales bacterium]|nr:Ig-like domain-containing protein [Rhodothermales bacterium]